MVRGGRVAVPLLVVVASVAILLALAVGYVQRTVVDSAQFANRATVALKDESVRTLIAERVTDQVVLKSKSDLLAARPLIQSVLASTVGSRAFTALFRAGVRDVHRAVFDRDQHTVTLAVGDIGTVAAAGLELVQPSLARRVRKTQHVDLIRRDVGDVTARLARAADAVRVMAPLLLLVAVIAAAGALLLSADRRRTVVQLGAGAAIAGVVTAVGLYVGRGIVVGIVDGPDQRSAVGAVWDAFLGDLLTAAWILAAAGAVVAAAAASLIRPVDIDEPLRRAGAWVRREPSRPGWKVARAIALVAVGLVLALDRDTVLQLLFTAVGIYLVYAGVSAILWLVYQPRRPRGERTARTGASGRRRTLIATLVAAGLIAAAIVTFVGSGGITTAAPAPGACNGHRELCNRPLDEVALPATHNAMSVPLPGWYSAEQERPIANQLGDGIRGLLVDTHYADRLPNGRLRTDFGDPTALRRKAAQDGVSPSALDAALRLREPVGFAGKGKRGMYLCHSFCELGGTPLADVLNDLHDFLVANPGEVVVVINQDYLVPKDFVGAVRAAGLDTMAYRGPTSGRWPTLREMIDSGQRVVFLAENHAGAAPWYHLAYKAITEETPYKFSRPAQLTERSSLAASCRPNRGPAEAPLFLLNHWITTAPVPRPSDASKVNAYGPLLRRARTCMRERDHLPNLVAVNFYRRGALERVVDTLNGIR